MDEKGRFEVRLGPEKIVNVRPENLMEPALNPGTQVEIHGLDPEAGKLWNGQKGCIIRYLAEDDKLQVHIEPEKTVNLKSDHLVRPPLGPGNQAEISGLESDSGRLMNGKLAMVMAYVEESGRFQVQLLEDGKVVNLKSENLCRPEIGPGDTVRVFGLESENGKLLNGQEGMITTLKNQTGRFEVRFRMLKLRYDNLRKVALPFMPGDCVEVCGLPNASGGKVLNGKRGRVTKYVKETGHFQVCLGPSKVMSLKPENLAKAADGLNPGDLVEAFGLSSESGSQLNGKTGVIVDYVEDSGRLEVLFEDETSARLKADNLKLLKPPPSPPEPGDEGSKENEKPQ